jgi:hypothetical protein
MGAHHILKRRCAMNKWKVVTLTIVLLCGLLLVLSIAEGLVGAVLAMESDNYAINWDVIGSGGEPSTSASFALNGTIGQGVVGSSSGDSYGLCGGYWCGGEIAYNIYLPLVLRNW